MPTRETTKAPRAPRAAAPAALGVLFLGLLGAAGCDSPTEPTTLEVDLTANPSPATAAASQGVFYVIKGDDTHPDETREYPWTTSFVVEMQETGGMGLEITAVNLKVQQASGGIVIAPSGGEVERYQFNSSASGNSLPARGHASVGFQVWYDLPNKGKEALVTVSLAFKEVNEGDDGVISSFQDAIDVKVAP
jgi:hypothetical protein